MNITSLTTLNEIHADIFEGLDFKTTRDIINGAFFHAGTTPTRDDVIAERLMQSPLVFETDNEGGAIADYATVRKLVAAFGEHLLWGLFVAEDIEATQGSA